MTVLTVYTENFDSKENVFGNGMSGKVFLESWDEHAEEGANFPSLDTALDYCERHGTKPDRIDFHYLGRDGTQKFWKLAVQ